jgi:hypothetical protein
VKILGIDPGIKGGLAVVSVENETSLPIDGAPRTL